MEKKKRTNNPWDKLVRKIDKCFTKRKYIGDIPISDGEYDRLMDHLKTIFNAKYNTVERYYPDPLLAVALVQIGIRRYDGRFWPYVEEIVGQKLLGPHQKWLGQCFYETLEKYDRIRVDRSEMMNNILLHCFITDHYAQELFDFLLMFYSIDLDRDLEQYDKEMKDSLIQSMTSGEMTKRAYKIKKHTSDAVTANEKGCRLRIGNILRYLDDALFNDRYPERSQNRVAQLFCVWAKDSSRFSLEKNRARGQNRQGNRQYNSPHFSFEGKTQQFTLVLPPQRLNLKSDEDRPALSWRILIDQEEKIVEAQIKEEGITSCWTEAIRDLRIDPADVFADFRIEILKNGVSVRKFQIKPARCRFFNTSWKMMVDREYLLPGQQYAFTAREDEITCEEGRIVSRETMCGLSVFSLDLLDGDILRLPDGKVRSVGRPLEEGLLQSACVKGAAVRSPEGPLPVFKAVPSVFFRMRPEQENGTIVCVNQKRHRFDPDACIRFNAEAGEENGFCLKLDEYVREDGVYEVIVDVPNSRKERRYSFAYVKGLSFAFDRPAYVFAEKGSVRLSEEVFSRIRDAQLKHEGASFFFPLSPETEALSFRLIVPEGTLTVDIPVPLLQWKMRWISEKREADDSDWSVCKPEDIWYQELPEHIFLKCPAKEVEFSMDPVLTDDEDQEDEDFSVRFSAGPDGVIDCDTRRIRSWLSKDEPFRRLYLSFDNQKFPFADVMTRDYLTGNKCEIVRTSKGYVIQTDEIKGYLDCFADVDFDDGAGSVRLAEKTLATYNCGVVLPVAKTGTYTVTLYESEEDEEDEFGTSETPDYHEIGKLSCRFEDPNDLSGRNLTILSVNEIKKDRSLFKPRSYELRERPVVASILPDGEEGSFTGELRWGKRIVPVRITRIDPDNKAFSLQRYNAASGGTECFFLDPGEKEVLWSGTDGMDAYERGRLIKLSAGDYQFAYKINKE